jgi:hypothetical protein
MLSQRINYFLPAGVILIVAGLVGTYLVMSHAGETLPTFDKEGALLRPEGYRGWMHVGTTVTPNEMNGGKALFPEFHVTYISPGSFEVFQKTGHFPDGTVFAKELYSVGSKHAESGNGYFMGEFVGLAFSVKDSAHFPDEPDNWAFFDFSDPQRKKGKPLPTSACSNCHQAGAVEQVFTQYYPILNEANSH